MQFQRQRLKSVTHCHGGLVWEKQKSAQWILSHPSTTPGRVQTLGAGSSLQRPQHVSTQSSLWSAWPTPCTHLPLVPSASRCLQRRRPTHWQAANLSTLLGSFTNISGVSGSGRPLRNSNGLLNEPGISQGSDVHIPKRFTDDMQPLGENCLMSFTNTGLYESLIGPPLILTLEHVQ